MTDKWLKHREVGRDAAHALAPEIGLNTVADRVTSALAASGLLKDYSDTWVAFDDHNKTVSRLTRERDTYREDAKLGWMEHAAAERELVSCRTKLAEALSNLVVWERSLQEARASAASTKTVRVVEAAKRVRDCYDGLCTIGGSPAGELCDAVDDLCDSRDSKSQPTRYYVSCDQAIDGNGDGAHAQVWDLDKREMRSSFFGADAQSRAEADAALMLEAAKRGREV